MAKRLLQKRPGARRSRRATIILAATGVALLALAGSVFAAGDWFASSDNPWPYSNPGHAPVLAAVGDISCQPGSPVEKEKSTDTCDQGINSTLRDEAQNATAQQVEAIKPALVAVLGDEQYQNGYYSDFENSFDKYWGAFKFLQRPTPGNHEFYDNHNQTGVRGLGYFDYYNGLQHDANGAQLNSTVTNPKTGFMVSQPTPQPYGQAGPFGTTGNGWYSYNVGHWHVISLNVECMFEPGGCPAAAATPGMQGTWFYSETQWLAQDLSQDHSPCTLAYWHQPTFSSTFATLTGDSNEGTAAEAWWALLFQHHATLILNGHDHVYTRFAPMDPTGKADPRNGIREFIVGTGGESLDTLQNPLPSVVQAATDQYYGVMKLTLYGDGYGWDYESALRAPGSSAPPTYSDKGWGPCRGGSEDN